MLICSLPPLPPNDFVNLFVFGGRRRISSLERSRLARLGGSRDHVGGALAPEPARFFIFGDFRRAFWGRVGSILGPICAELDHN